MCDIVKHLIIFLFSGIWPRITRPSAPPTRRGTWPTCYRVTVVSLNDQKQTIYKETSGIKQASLGKNESCVMLELDPVKTVFPLLLSFNFCVSTSLISSNLQDPIQE